MPVHRKEHFSRHCDRTGQVPREEDKRQHMNTFTIAYRKKRLLWGTKMAIAEVLREEKGGSNVHYRAKNVLRVTQKASDYIETRSKGFLGRVGVGRKTKEG